MMETPFLLMDIDGVISLFGFKTDERPAGTFLPVEGIPHFLSATAGEHLQSLSEHFDVVWCTGWEERANEHLPPALGLQTRFPHISFDRNPSNAGAHWKLAAIDAYCGADRALAWVDDTHSDGSRGWAAERPGPTLLVETDPAVGLTAEHVTALIAWAREREGAARR